jgi:hypothetical protein
MTTPVDDTDTENVSDDDIIQYIVDRASNDDDFLDSLVTALDDAGLLDEEADQEDTGNTGNTGATNGATDGNGSQSATETALRNLIAGQAG